MSDPAKQGGLPPDRIPPKDGHGLYQRERRGPRRMLPIAQELLKMGWKLMATSGNAAFMAARGLPVKPVLKVSEGRPNIVDHIKNREVDLIIKTPLGQRSRTDEYTIGWAAIKNRVAFITTLSAAEAILRGLRTYGQKPFEYRCLQEYYGK